MDKFLLAENPLRPEQSGLWVIHLLNPAIIQCRKGFIECEQPFIHETDASGQAWTLSIYHLFTTDFLTEPQEQALPVMKRAWRWFRSYLQLEDKNIDHEEN